MVADLGTGQDRDMTQNPPGADAGPTSFDPSRLSTITQARRSTDDKMLAGVCGGLGRYLGVDPVLLRVVLALLTVFGGAGAVIYIAMWLLLPEEGSDRSLASIKLGRSDDELRPIGWIIAIVVAVGVLGSSSWVFPFHTPWPLLVPLLLWYFFFHRRRRGWGRRRWNGNDRPSGETARSWDREAAAASTGPAPGPTVTTGSTGDADAASGPGDGIDWSAPDPLGLHSDVPPPPPPPPAPRPPSLFWPTIGATMIALAALAVVDLAGVSVSHAAYVLVALGGVGLGLLTGAFFGRARSLIPVGLLLVPAAAFAIAAPNPSFGQINATPGSADDVQRSYDLTAGQVHLDLSQVDDPDQLPGRTVDIDVLTGEVQVVLPKGIPVAVSSSAKVGQLNILNREVDGTTIDSDVISPAAGSGPYLTLDIEMGAGEVTVIRS
jgi:phage shock protein PspC (stress-responsive transcriptional regulator)